MECQCLAQSDTEYALLSYPFYLGRMGSEVFYLLMGIGRAVYESTNKAIFADFFPGEAPAVAQYATVFRILLDWQDWAWAMMQTCADCPTGHCCFFC